MVASPRATLLIARGRRWVELDIARPRRAPRCGNGTWHLPRGQPASARALWTRRREHHQRRWVL